MALVGGLIVVVIIALFCTTIHMDEHASYVSSDKYYFNYKGNDYPNFQTQGFAAQFAIPFAKHFCKGKGLDIGCMKPDWAYPGAIMIDPKLDPTYDAMKLPEGEYDYIFSSHCLEHLPNWVQVLDYWTTKIKSGGVIFLYLPGYSQEYWRPWNNTKHLNILCPQYLEDYFNHKEYTKVFTSGNDLNASFMVVAIK